MGSIYLVRHGQASFGQSDYDKLSRVGHEQASVLGASLRRRLPKVDRVVTGGMVRHRETAEECLVAMRVADSIEAAASLLTVDEGFAEYDHEEVIARHEPRYENKLVMMADFAKTLEPRRAFQAVFDEAVVRWVGGQHDAEYKEPWPIFRARSMEAVERLVGVLGGSKTALVFTSGGVIAAVTAVLLGVPDAAAFRLQWRLVNCGVTKLIYGRSGTHVATLNEHTAFEGPEAQLVTYR